MKESAESRAEKGSPPEPLSLPLSYLPSPDFDLDHLKAENKMLRDSLKARGVDPDLLLRTLAKNK